MTDAVVINRLPTNVPGLDDVLGGGLPEYSFNLIAGGPGCGKTTLMQQMMFGAASAERPAIYFTILGEPPLKMLRYQQQFSFFDPAMLDGRIRFVHLGQELIEGGLEKVLNTIVQEVARSSPRFVVVDSFRSAMRESTESPLGQDLRIQNFVQQLALHLTAAQATTFLVGEYLTHETSSNPLFTIADGIIWLHQTDTRNSVIRRLQVLKLRGQKEVPGFHTYTMSNDGVRVYPRLGLPASHPDNYPAARPIGAARQATGVAGLDELLGGGVPPGFCVLVVGPSGAGKSVLATQFAVEGARLGEPGLIALFERTPRELHRTTPRAIQLDEQVRAGKVEFLYLRPLDLSVEETMEAIRERVAARGIKRLVVDSLSGLELALAPQFREDFRESLYRLVSALTSLGVTVMMTVEVTDSYEELRLSSHGFSFLSDALILQRYVEVEGRLRKVMAVVKMRGHAHSEEFREYDISEGGVVVGKSVTGLTHFLAGRAVTRKQ